MRALLIAIVTVGVVIAALAFGRDPGITREARVGVGAPSVGAFVSEPMAYARAALKRSTGIALPPRIRPRFCTAVGCSSRITVRMRRLPATALAARVCSRGRCRTTSLGRDARPEAQLSPGPCRGGRDRVRRVRIDLLDIEGVRVATATGTLRLGRQQPNGPRCGPTCWRSSLTYDGRTGRLSG